MTDKATTQTAGTGDSTAKPTAKQTVFVKDLPNKRLTVERSFDAPLDLVWRAWTESEILDQWWAPKPYMAITKKMDFREGGQWLYLMKGPKGDGTWCRVDFNSIVPKTTIINTDTFCDEAGNKTPGIPNTHWNKQFRDNNNDSTTVNIELTFEKEADLEWLVGMGFQEGLTAGLSNLDQYLSTQFKLRQQQKPDNRARVTTYLNFPGNTEEAFNFYKKVFRGEFTGRGLQRYGDVDLPAGGHPMSESDKKLVLHVELTILGGHVLMATDAPESMGFTVTPGNNMFINLEPDSREETQRLFDALSAGGTVTMPLQDMFWGAYFASFTDKYGISWMLNFQTTAAHSPS